MEWNYQTRQFLCQWFLDTLSPQVEPRRRAERNLSDAADNPNYALSVLRLVDDPSVDEHIRHCAAVNFKNHVKTRWTSSDTTEEKQGIKQLIVRLMLCAKSPKIQAQLSEALTVIGKHDFPKLWPDLLPELGTSLETAMNAHDFASVNRILATLNSLFKKFRYLYKTGPVLSNLKECLDTFAKPYLLRTVEGLSNAAAGDSSSVNNLFQLIEAQRLCCRIFYSLNKMDLPEVFEDDADKWMNEFIKYLTYPVIEYNGADGVTLVDGLRAAVCDIISHYVEHEEDFVQNYLHGFVAAVWDRLVDASADPRRERFTVTAIKFLTVVSTSVHHHLLSGDDETVQQFTQKIVIPNVMLRDEDEELFEDNFVEFIRRDIEGSDLDTRRRIACELLKGIAGNYRHKISETVSSQIKICLALFAENPAANWKYKDCAIYLAVSLATKKASVSTDLVDVESVFRSAIVPELKGQDVNNAFPLLKAAALKFFTMFRVVIPKPDAMDLLGDVVRFLRSDVNVVHSYAAICIEKLLLVKENGGQARYTSADIGPILPGLITNLFCALEKPESEENQYIMRCIMRVLQISDISPEVASPCIAWLTSVLDRVCKNPKNPVFNHYLFEAVAALVRRACERDPSLVRDFDTCLQMILRNQVKEFFPYAFQLLAQLVDLHRPPVPQNYMQIFDYLLTPDLWRKSANVPALVGLLQSFLQRASNEIKREGRLNQVLGVFQQLVSSPKTEEQAFYILNPIIENLGCDVIAEYINRIWTLLFCRLHHSSPRLVRCLIISMSLFLVKHDIQTLVESINSVQANLFQKFVEKYWIPYLSTITGTIEVKLSAVASSKLLCESPSLLDPAAEELWGMLLDGIVTLLSHPDEARVAADEPEVPDFGAATGYQATFVRLHNAGRREEDPLRGIQDPRHYLMALLANLSTQFRGRFPPIITRYLSQANQAALFQLCCSYNLALV